MDENRRSEAVLLACAAAGAMLGIAIRRHRRSQAIELPRLVRQGIGTAGAAVAIATQVGVAVGIDEEDEQKRAVVAFATAAGLSLLADYVGSLVPGIDVN